MTRRSKAIAAMTACATGALLGLSGCQSSGGAGEHTSPLASGERQKAREAGAPASDAGAATKIAIAEGDTAPDFALPDENGERVRLASLLRAGPVVVIFFRGEWCPYCNNQLKEFERTIEQFKARGATLVAISPQTIAKTGASKAKNEASYRFLSDEGSGVARRYGISFELDDAIVTRYKGFGIDLPASNGVEAWELPLGATYVIDQSGVVRYAYIDEDYRKRPSPREILDALDRSAG